LTARDKTEGGVTMTQASYRKPLIGERTEAAPQAPTTTFDRKPMPKLEKAKAEGTGYPGYLMQGAKDTATGYPSMAGTTHVSGCQGTYSSIM
jgi:hypothetical protein